MKGDPKAIAHIVPNGKTINVKHVHIGALPKGSGGALLARTIQASGTKPQRLIMTNVIHSRTLSDYRAGKPAAKTTLGRMAANTAAYLGRTVRKTEYRKDPRTGHLNIVVHLN